LKEIAKQEIDMIRFEHPFFDLEIDRIIGTDNSPGLLEKWLKEELLRIETNNLFKPVLFEFAFGTNYFGKKQSSIDYVDVNGLKIQGKVDRVELFSDSGKFAIMIGDYKNRMDKVAKNSDVRSCKSFQMPLYLLAVQNILKKYYGIDAELKGGIYYGFEPEIEKDKIISHKFVLVEQTNLRVPKSLYRSNKQVLGSSENIIDILNNSLENAKQIVNKISQGIFPVEPQDNACQYCSYSSLCRIKENKGINDISAEEHDEAEI
jgi:ATP-dependent helicase/DNAse subunit B